MKNLDVTTKTGRKNFYRTQEWQFLRNFILSRNPLCERCLKNDRIEIATEVHHIRDLAYYPEGRLDLENLEPLCKKCHNSHTAKEQSGSSKDLTPITIFNPEVEKLNKNPK